MGHIVNHAIVVTSYTDEMLNAARQKAIDLGAHVTELVEHNINGESSFLIVPDGSKSGWDASDAGDARRDEWIAWARSQRHEDQSSPLAWVEVAYGSDDANATVTRSEWVDDEASEDSADV
jgi:hypothetical protein